MQGPPPKNDLFKNCASKRISRATPVFPLRFSRSRSGPFSLNANRGNDVRGVSKSSRGGGIFIDVIWIRTMAVTVMLNLCVENVRLLLPVFPLTPFGSLYVFLIGNCRRQ